MKKEYQKYLDEKIADTAGVVVPLNMQTEFDKIIEIIGTKAIEDAEYREKIGVPDDLIQSKDQALITRFIIQKAFKDNNVLNIVTHDLYPFTSKDLKDVLDVLKYW